MSGSYWQGVQGIVTGTLPYGSGVSISSCVPVMVSSATISYTSPFETLEKRINDLEREFNLLKAAIIDAIQHN